jgi:transglutaminase-like putative cysteine protease
MSEVIGLRSAVAAKLGETEATLRQSGSIPPEIITRHTDFATKTLSAFANLETIAANLAALIAQGNPTAAALGSLITALQTLAPPPPSIPVDPQLPHRMAEVELISPPPLPPITPGITPPGPQDLAPTTDVQITPEIQALAVQLNNDPEEIFLYVRNTIDYQPYFGSVKGSPGAYWEKAGNDMDQASLLMALLRAANIPCRYVSGTVKFNRNTMLNWTGAKTTQALLNILSTSGIPFDNLLGTRAREPNGSAWPRPSRPMNIFPALTSSRPWASISMLSTTTPPPAP